jgi:hypothetical protein
LRYCHTGCGAQLGDEKDATMLDLLHRLDFWLTIGALGFFVMLEFDRLRAWWKRRQAGRTVKHPTQSGGIVMSRPLIGSSPSSRIASNVDKSLTAGQSGKSVNESLPVNDAATEENEGERDITDTQRTLQYRERLQTLADLINGGVVAQAEGIEKAFGVTRSGRKESKYAQIRADLMPLLKKQGDAVSPIANRPLPASATFHSDNPELEYQEP